MYGDITLGWKINPFVDLNWYTWDEESVVFDQASGDTHLFEPISVEVLQLIEESETSLSMHDIVQHLLPMLNESEEDVMSHVQKVMATFNRLGLVEPDHT